MVLYLGKNQLPIFCGHIHEDAGVENFGINGGNCGRFSSYKVEENGKLTEGFSQPFFGTYAIVDMKGNLPAKATFYIVQKGNTKQVSNSAQKMTEITNFRQVRRLRYRNSFFEGVSNLFKL